MPRVKTRLEKTDDRLLCDSYRIIDANYNRAKEGLRVCEEISRFHLKSLPLTKKMKRLRHDLTVIMKTSRIDPRLLFRERDSHSDFGRDILAGKKVKSFKAIFMANAQRTKEALRVLEEFLKIFDQKASNKILKLRFNFYAVEKESVKRFPALLDPR